MSAIASRTLARTTRSASRAPLCLSSRLARPSSLITSSRSSTQTLPSTVSNTAARSFMASHIPKSDAQAAPAPAQQYDNEIVDMAKYAHGYKVDSDLAVSISPTSHDCAWWTCRG